MNLYICIKDGQPFEHPIMEDNFIQAFPNIDVNNLPLGFAKFERIAAPALGAYQKNQRVQYELGIDGIYRDTWYYDEMTTEEIKIKQDETKEQWISNSGYVSWIFNEETCAFEAPIPYPNDDKIYSWNEDLMSWVQVI